ncbi:MAG: hypothetical protein ABI439_08495 [Rhodospirillales bacterium]
MPLPGRTMITTPVRPTRTASPRRQPTVSPSNGTDKAVINSGEAKEMA